MTERENIDPFDDSLERSYASSEMEPDQSYISASVSQATKSLMQEYADAHGVKKNRLVEDALLHHLQALRALPADVIIPPRIVVTAESGEAILKHIENPRRPTEALRQLLKK